MISILISYYFRFVTEDHEFTYELQKINNALIYELNLPLMDNAGMLIESPSAKPYKIPVPYGIKEFDYSLIPRYAKIVSINSSLFSIGEQKTKINPMFTVEPENANMGKHRWGTINEYPAESTVSNALFEYDTLIFYSGHAIIPCINGKSPNFLFTVDGSGNNITLLCENTTTPSAYAELFSLDIYNIKFGGVPSEDYGKL